jgi:Autophagocytosis associated protein, active-site domain
MTDLMTTNSHDVYETDKQFLITRNVPCQNRVASMENHLATELEDTGDGEDWLVSHLVKETNLEDEFDILDEDGEIVEQSKPPAQTSAADNENDEYEDMEGFEDNDILEDAAATSASPAAQEESNLLKTRTVRAVCLQIMDQFTVELEEQLMYSNSFPFCHFYSTIYPSRTTNTIRLPVFGWWEKVPKGSLCLGRK